MSKLQEPENWTLSNWIILRSFPREMWLQYVIYEITIGKNCSIIALFIDSYPVTVVFLVSWNCKAKPLFIVQLTIRDSLGAFDTPSVWGNLNSNSCCYFRCISICWIWTSRYRPGDWAPHSQRILILRDEGPSESFYIDHNCDRIRIRSSIPQVQVLSQTIRILTEAFSSLFLMWPFRFRQ